MREIHCPFMGRCRQHRLRRTFAHHFSAHSQSASWYTRNTRLWGYRRLHILLSGSGERVNR
jgi:hypothetical protein